MRTKRTLARIAVTLVGSLALASTVRADAPTDQYSSFTRQDVVIVDRITELTWDRAVQSGAYSGGGGNAVTACVSQGKRVPTLKELLTLVDENPTKEYENGAETYKAIDVAAFPKTPAEPFFSSSVALGKPGERVWGVDFATGAVVDLPTSETHKFRCVK